MGQVRELELPCLSREATLLATPQMHNSEDHRPSSGVCRAWTTFFGPTAKVSEQRGHSIPFILTLSNFVSINSGVVTASAIQGIPSALGTPSKEPQDKGQSYACYTIRAIIQHVGRSCSIAHLFPSQDTRSVVNYGLDSNMICLCLQC